MLTFDQLKGDRSLLDPFPWAAVLEVACSHCGTPHPKTKEKLIRSLKDDRHGVYCTRSCVRKGAHERDLFERDGVVGRFCKVCEEWLPLPKMGNTGRSKTCNVCWGKRPLQRFNEYKRKAPKRGWVFHLTYQEFMQFWQVPCVYCGEAIETIGLDRVDTFQDYTLDNVVSCCKWCNYAKHQSTHEEFLRKCRVIAARHLG